MLLLSLFCIFLVSLVNVADGELKPVSLLALGRPFSLGDLYDRRRDTIVQGPKLWSHEELKDYRESNSFSTKFEIVTSESIDEDMKHFDLSASIKMSFLAGLITVSGSASYLDDRKKKNNQARVSLKYKSTTFKRELKPHVFTKVTYPDVIKKATDATDVVVAIQYGAGAIFTFDRSVSQNERKRDIQGTLAVMVKKIPTFEVSGEGKVQIGEEERKNTDSFTCKFHGDFVLRNHPGTYQEAIKVYKDLPDLLGQNYENSVPVKVWLYPIEKLPLAHAAQVVYKIKESLVISVTDQIEDLQNIIRQCNDILESQVSAHHGRIRMKVSNFKSYVERYVLLYKQKLVSILPDIRKGTASMSELTRLVTEKERSPFAQRNLQIWISRFNEEVSVLSRIQSLPNYCRDSGDFSAQLLNGKKYTLGLTLKIGKNEDAYLDAIRNFLITEQNSRLPSQNIGKWWKPGSMTLYNLQVLSSTFKQFYQIKQREAEGALTSPEVQFLVREEIIEGGQSESIDIELYNGAWLSKRNYQLTTAPGRPKSSTQSHDYITIYWNAPEKGKENLSKYIVRCYTIRTKEMSENCDGNYCKVAEKVVAKTNMKYTLRGLKSQTPYYFTVSSSTELGETATSISSEQIETKKCSPGYYDAGKGICNICSKGTYTNFFGLKACKKCPKGSYGGKTGLKKQSDCQQCPQGTYNGKEGADAASDCVKCPAGSYNSRRGSRTPSDCTKCPKGTYNGNSGQTGESACFKCRTNSYNDREGESKCKTCPSGMQTKESGAVYVSECQSSSGSTQVQSQLKAMKDKVDNDLEDFQDEMEESEKQVADALKKLEEHKNTIAKTVQAEIQGLKNEVTVLFSCSWKVGDGVANGNDAYDAYAGEFASEQACVYKCLQMRSKTPIINGATYEAGRRKCWCEKSQDSIKHNTKLRNCKFSS